MEMIENNDRLVIYLNTVVSSVFKILPLYEEKNIGLNSYISSLLFELYGLEKVINIKHSQEYISLLSTLESIKTESFNSEDNKSTIKREVFKCISTIKNMISKIEEGE